MVEIGWQGRHKEPELLPLIPFDMGGWTAFLPPSHPFVRDTPEAKAAAVKYAQWAKEHR